MIIVHHWAHRAHNQIMKSCGEVSPAASETLAAIVAVVCRDERTLSAETIAAEVRRQGGSHETAVEGLAVLRDLRLISTPPAGGLFVRDAYSGSVLVSAWRALEDAL